VLEQKPITDHQELKEFVAEIQFFNNNGWTPYEGLMLRSPYAPYKYGPARSTLTGGELLRIKFFEEAEATVVGIEELVYEHEPSKKSGLIGAYYVISRDFTHTFKIGSGFTDQQRKEVYPCGTKLIFQYQKLGSTKEAPRTPTFKRFI